MSRQVAVEYLAQNFAAAAAKGHAVANASLLRALVRHAPDLELACLAGGPSAPDDFYRLLDGFGYRGPRQAADHAGLEGLSASILLMPHLQMADLAWLRRRFGQRRLSLCALMHTLAGQATAQATALLSAPLQPWDAVVSTSRASLAALTFALDAQAEFLRERFGATRVPRPHCALIPLGIDVAAFRPDGTIRAQTRHDLGIGPDEVVLLSVARRSFHAKAHPTALYRTAEQVATRLGSSLILIECGRPGSDAIDRAHDEEAARLCPSVRRISLPAREQAALPALYAAADIFMALVDNFQETFGLAVVEAMAAGLPVVASDWDGLRDTVLDGVTGFLVQTLQPPALFGEDLAVRLFLRIDDDDRFKGNTCQFVAVDVERAASAVHQLAMDVPLRRRMGEAGRERVHRLFDWRHIVPCYLDLWADLDSIRAAAEETAPRQSGGQTHPAYPDPFALFAGYASHHLALSSLLVAGPRDPGELATVLGTSTNAYVAGLLPAAAELTRLMGMLSSTAISLESLLTAMAEDRRWLIFRSLAFLAKHGFVTIVHDRKFNC